MANSPEQIATNLITSNAELVTSVDNLTEKVVGKMAEIDSKTNDAIKSLSENNINYYVDPFNGDDNNHGKDFENAFKTFEQAMSIAIAPALNGASITIYIESNHSYHIDRKYEIYHRSITVKPRTTNAKATIIVDPVIIESNINYMGTYGIELYNSSFQFSNCIINTPRFSEIAGHDNIATQSNGGLFRPVPHSLKSIYFNYCDLNCGDQFLLSPSPADTTAAHFFGCSFSLREGRLSSIAPIAINSSTLNATFVSCVLNDGLSFSNNSLISGVVYQSGVQINLVSNVAVAEAV